MQKSTRFPLLFRIWVITSGVVFALALGLVIFFDWTDYGFLYNGALLWTGAISFTVFLVGLTVRLCKRVYKCKALKLLLVIACVLFMLLGLFMFFGYVLSEWEMGITNTNAASIIAGSDYRDRYNVHISPEETNRVVVINANGLVYAYPMLNRCIYKEIQNSYVWDGFDDENTVDWPTEQQAVVTVIWLPDEPDGFDTIFVDF